MRFAGEWLLQFRSDGRALGALRGAFGTRWPANWRKHPDAVDERYTQRYERAESDCQLEKIQSIRQQERIVLLIILMMMCVWIGRGILRRTENA